MKRKKIKTVSFRAKGKASKGTKPLRKRRGKVTKKFAVKRGGKRTGTGVRRRIPVQPADNYNQQYDAGFDSSYNEGYSIGYAEGIRDGQEEANKGA